MNEDNGGLTLAHFNKMLDYLFRKKLKNEKMARQWIDWSKMKEYKIKFAYDSCMDTYLFSSSEMRRARKVGAVGNE